jgi:hypothetical protein
MKADPVKEDLSIDDTQPVRLPSHSFELDFRTLLRTS